MSNKLIKIFGIIFVLLIILTNICFADSFIDPDNYKPSGPTSSNDYDQVVVKVDALLGMIQVIGMIISVIILMILGIKYMIGSVEERASYKKTFMPYLIGVAILFTGTLLPEIIYNWAHKLG